MARKPINYGINAGDGQGDIIFQSFKNADDNFIELYAQSEGTVSVHSDMDFNGITLVDEMILKWNGVQQAFIPALKRHIQSLTPKENTSTLPLNMISTPITFQRAGVYMFEIHSSYSLDSTGQRFISRASLDGVFMANIANGQMINVEGKESGGNDGDGRGTSVKDTFSRRYYVNVPFAGSFPFVVDFNCNSNGVEAYMWDTTVIVEEVFNIITV